MLPIVICAGAGKGIVRGDGATLERGGADHDLIRATGRVRSPKGTGDERITGVVVELVELGRGDGRDEQVRVERRPGGHREHVAVVRVNEDDGAGLAPLGEQVLAHALEVEVERGDDRFARHGGGEDTLRGLVALGVEGQG